MFAKNVSGRIFVHGHMSSGLVTTMAVSNMYLGGKNLSVYSKTVFFDFLTLSSIIYMSFSYIQFFQQTNGVWSEYYPIKYHSTNLGQHLQCHAKFL